MYPAKKSRQHPSDAAAHQLEQGTQPSSPDHSTSCDQAEEPPVGGLPHATVATAIVTSTFPRA